MAPVAVGVAGSLFARVPLGLVVPADRLRRRRVDRIVAVGVVIDVREGVDVRVRAEVDVGSLDPLSALDGTLELVLGAGVDVRLDDEPVLCVRVGTVERDALAGAGLRVEIDALSDRLPLSADLLLEDELVVLSLGGPGERAGEPVRLEAGVAGLLRRRERDDDVAVDDAGVGGAGTDRPGP